MLAGLVALWVFASVSEPAGGKFPVLIVHGRQDSVVLLKAGHYARESLVALGVWCSTRNLTWHDRSLACDP